MQYENNQNRFKLCALCNNRIHKDHVVCQDHLPEMEVYRNELWFQELCKMQERQYEIEVAEYRYINGLNYIPTLQKSYKTRGKQLSYTIKNEIFRLYRSGLGDRKIAKRLQLPFYTVNKLLTRHRKNRKM